MGKGRGLIPMSPVAPEPQYEDDNGDDRGGGRGSFDSGNSITSEKGRVLKRRHSFQDAGVRVMAQLKASKAFQQQRTESLIVKERTTSAQRVGRDGSQTSSFLLSELKLLSPMKFFLKRWIYRAEAALESVRNRIYALLFTVIFMLIISVVSFVLVLWITESEFSNLNEDSNGYDDTDESDDTNDDNVSYHRHNENVYLFAAWLTWSCFVDPGFHTEIDPFRYKWGRLIAALISLLGILFFSFVLGFVVELMQSFIARVTEGKSSVIESGHYLILGFSEKCIAIIGELALAMESDGGGVIVVLADHPTKADFDNMVNTHLNTLNLSAKPTVVFRPGSPIVTANLLKVSPESSRAIVILSDMRQDENHADAIILRIILSLKSILGQNGYDHPPEPPLRAGWGSTFKNSLGGSPSKDRRTSSSSSGSGSGLGRSGSGLGLGKSPPPRTGSGRDRRGSPMMSPSKHGNGGKHGKHHHNQSGTFVGSLTNSKVAQFFSHSSEDNLIARKSQSHNFKGHIIAELRDNDNTPIIKVSGGTLVELVVVHDIVGRILAKSTIQPNIRRIYDDLLGFDGCEFYFASHPELLGCTFKDASIMMKGAVLVGVKRGGEIILNPDAHIPPENSHVSHRKHVNTKYHHQKHSVNGKGEFMLQMNDEIIFIAEDDSSYEVLDRPYFTTEDLAKFRPWPPVNGELTAQQSIEKLEALERDRKHKINAALNVDGGMSTPRNLSPRRNRFSHDSQEEGKGGIDHHSSGASGGTAISAASAADGGYVGLELQLAKAALRASSPSSLRDNDDERMRNSLNDDVRRSRDDVRNSRDDVRDSSDDVRNSRDDVRRSRDDVRNSRDDVRNSRDDVRSDDLEKDKDWSRLNCSSSKMSHDNHKQSIEIETQLSPTSTMNSSSNSMNRNALSPLPHMSTPNNSIHNQSPSSLPNIHTLSPITPNNPSDTSADVINSGDYHMRTPNKSTEIKQQGIDAREVHFTTNTFSSPTGVHANTDNNSNPQSRNTTSNNNNTSLSQEEEGKKKENTQQQGLHVLLCGWRRDVKDMLNLMEHLLPPGSVVHILSEKPPALVEAYVRDFCDTFRRIEIKHSFGRADIRRSLVETDACGFCSNNAIDVVVVTADESKEKDLLLSDSQTIASCLLVRDVQANVLENREVSLTDFTIPQLEQLHVNCPMTVEILDVATNGTIEENPSIKAVADFVVVNDFASRVIAAVADRREVAAVLGELLGPDPLSQDIFVIEATALLYEDEVVGRRGPACVDIGDDKTPTRGEAFMNRYAKRRITMANYMGAQPSSPSSSSEGNNKTQDDNASHPPATPTSSYIPHIPQEMAKAVSFSEMARRAAAPPRHGILLGYIKASWNAKDGCVGELVTVFNPISKAAPIYWHSRDFLIIMSMEEHRDPGCANRFTVVR